MRKILVIRYSQTGQLSRISESIVAPLLNQPDIQVDYLTLKPVKDFPFPWPFFKFFHVFPETVKMTPQELEPISQEIMTTAQDYDLVILAYQVWFLSPSLPISSFLQSEQGQSLIKNKPVVTVIGCRGMWLSAQEKMKSLLESLNARLIDNVALTDDCGAAFSFLATPLWMFTGRKKAYSWTPKAGVSEDDISNAKRFGIAIKKRLLRDDSAITGPMLTGLGAVTINEKFIASERVGQHSFAIWSKIIGFIGPMHSFRRSCGILLYATFLFTLILTVVPISVLVKKIIKPFSKQRTQQQKAYFAKPSGE